MARREHRYRITVEHIAAPGEDIALHAPLTFEDGNHDDLFRIVDLQRGSGRFASEDEAAAFAIGLKQLKAPLGDFIRQLKAAASNT